MKALISNIGLVWLALVILKALDHIVWAWPVVLFFPVWFPVATALAVIACVLIFIVFIVLLLLVLGCFGVFREVKE